MSAPGDERFGRAALLAGAFAGIALAGLGIARSGRPSVPADAIAVVNGQSISRETFARFTAAVAAERRLPELDASTRRHLLRRMLDEELLLQRGIDLGLARHEPTARRSIVSALIASITADAEMVEPDDEELRRFHRENGDLFRRTDRLEVDAALVSAGGRPDPVALERAHEIGRRARAGEPFAVVRDELGDRPVAELPGGALPAETIREYLGPTAARTAMGLAPGEVSAPVRGSAGYWVLHMRARQSGELPDFESVRAEVRAAWLRQRGDAALREYLATLRESSEIQVLDPELAGP